MTPTAKELVKKIRQGAECVRVGAPKSPDVFIIQDQQSRFIGTVRATPEHAWLRALEMLPAEEVVRARWPEAEQDTDGFIRGIPHQCYSWQSARDRIIHELKAGEKEGKDE
jgi:hypothetical protein